MLLFDAAFEFCYTLSRSKDAIKLGARGAFIFQYCLYAELGRNVTERAFFTTKKEKKVRAYNAF